MIRTASLCLAAILAASVLSVPAEAAKSCIGKRGLSYKIDEKLKRCNKAIARAERKNRKERLATALIERGMIRFDSAQRDAALQDARAALAIAQSLKPGEKVRMEIAALGMIALVHDANGEKDGFSATTDQIAAKDIKGVNTLALTAVLTRGAHRHGMLDKSVELIGLSLSQESPDKLRHVMLMARGVNLWRLERLDEAQADLEAAIAIEDGWEPRLTLARIHRKQGRFDAALADYKAALGFDHFDPEIMKITASLINHRQYGTPTEYLSGSPRTVISPSPIGSNEYKAAALYAQVLLERCEMLLDMERVEDAAKDCGRAVSLFPKNLKGLKVLHRLALARGDDEEAARQAEALKAREAEAEAQETPEPPQTPDADMSGAAQITAPGIDADGERVERKILSPSAAGVRKAWNRMSTEMRAIYTVLHG